LDFRYFHLYYEGEIKRYVENPAPSQSKSFGQSPNLRKV
jgi:hypothetical protein